MIRQAVDPDANVIFGVCVDPNMGNDIRLTLIATGFATKEQMANATDEKELARILKGIQDDELDVPSYTRRQQNYYQPQKTAPIKK